MTLPLFVSSVQDVSSKSIKIIAPLLPKWIHDTSFVLCIYLSLDCQIEPLMETSQDQLYVPTVHLQKRRSALICKSKVFSIHPEPSALHAGSHLQQ
jgi:hypothetical protein